MITIATLLWAPNKHSAFFSQHYTESDAEKLYRGFARNLSVPFRFVCYVDRIRDFAEPIEQRLITGEPNYGSCIQPYEMNEPMILVGLDTIIVGNCDHFAAYAIGATKLAVPMDPFHPEKGVCNGVALVPGGHSWIWRDKPPEMNDMDWIRAQDVSVLDDLFPGQILSFKRHVRKQGLPEDARIIFFHGELKPHELPHIGWIARHWHDNVKAAA